MSDAASSHSALDAVFERIARSRGLPVSDKVAGPAEHERAWSRYDWSKQGYEWGPKEWVQRMLAPMFAIALKPKMRVVEIGPGAGRVTELLLGEGRELVLADISRKCLDQTLERFEGHEPKLRAVLMKPGGGAKELVAALPPESVDALVSWDCFVHIDAATAASYLAALRGLMRPGAYGIVHHPDTRHAGGWRSDLHLAAFVDMLVANDFTPLSHVRYVDEHVHLLGHYDYVSLFRRGLEAEFAARADHAKKSGRGLTGEPLP